MVVHREIDLTADLNAQEDDGLGWSVLRDATDPERLVPGTVVLAGNNVAAAVVRVIAVDNDGQVHVSILPGSIEENLHLLSPGPA